MNTNIIRRFFLLLLLFVLVQSCHVGRYFYWNFADVNDYRKFPAVPVDKGDEPFHYHYPGHPVHIELPQEFAVEETGEDLRKFLKDQKTLAFLIVRNDTIIFEEYYSGYSDSAVIPSFSVSKVFVSALTGIAIHEGHIRSVDEPVTTYLPELLKQDTNFKNITIGHLLNMRSGIKFNEGYANPFADMAKFYYGRRLKKYISRLNISGPPGQRYDYISVNSLLLAMIIEQSTGKPLNEYLSEKIWKPLGMEFDATWNTDSKKGNQIKAFCCLNARAADFAKFGSLYLNHGKWNGKQIVPEDWVETSMSVINDSEDSQGYPYTYQWRVKEDGAIFAKGVLGQYIYADPGKNVVIVRMGKKSGDVIWPEFFGQLCKKL